jgi:gamma-glutamylcyclotransferase (GGCT)/AIG2-like uncharacterized protein YtfP
MTADLFLPYAVYGTLRKDQPNSGLMKDGAVWLDNGTIDGYRLIHNGYFPYAVPAKDQRIVVDVFVPAAYKPLADALRYSLDTLEGYPDHYDRVEVTADTNQNGDVRCWLYTPSCVAKWPQFDEMEPVPDNDWSPNAKRCRRAAFVAHRFL